MLSSSCVVSPYTLVPSFQQENKILFKAKKYSLLELFIFLDKHLL